MRGWRCLYVPAAVVHHHHGATIGHGSSLKYFHVGLNRVRTLAKNADSAQLRRHGLAMIGYDIAYVTYAGDHRPHAGPAARAAQGPARVALLPARRRAHARPVELAPTRGLRAALGRRSAWLRNSATRTR